MYRRLGGYQGWSGQVRKISPLPGLDPRTVQPVASRYNDYATRPTLVRSQSQYILSANTNSSSFTDVHTKINRGTARCLNLTQLQGSPHIGLLVITPQTPCQFRFPVAPNLPRFVKHPAKLCNCLTNTREVYRRITAAFLLLKGGSSV